MNTAIDCHGRLVDRPRIRAGFLGCGSHSFRNLFPAFQFAPVELAAVCDLDLAKAQAFAKAFGGGAAYASLDEMLARERLDAVFIVTGYDRDGRPTYPALAERCLAAGANAWIEKPPAASVAELERLEKAARAAGRQVMVGFKKMFSPANEKAKELMLSPDFGRPSLVVMRYPQHVPPVEVIRGYFAKGRAGGDAVGFLDHICHPVSHLLHLLGMPRTLHYEAAASGAGVATFAYAGGELATMALTGGASTNGGMESTLIVSDRGRHITVENNLRVTLHRHPGTAYGATPSFYLGQPNEANAVWEPEFSLGQLYNKGLFLLGYVGEIAEFAEAVLAKRPVRLAGIEHARQATRIAEAFAEGPGKTIVL